MHDFIPDMAAKRAELTPKDIAFTTYESGEQWSYERVNEAANGLAHSLKELGLAAGDRLGILTRNNVEFFVTLFACQKAKLVLAPLNWRQPVAELQPVIEGVGISAIMFDEPSAVTGAQLARQFGIASIGINAKAAHSFDDLRKGKGKPINAMVDANSVWYLLFTSGTTGVPKAVIQTPKMAWANAINIGQAIGLTRSDRAVNYLPLFHTAGINLYTLPVFLNGGLSTIVPQFDADALVAMIGRKEVSKFFGVPAIYQMLSLRDDFDEIDFEGIKFGCGGAALAENLIAKYAARGALICNGFGMTETGPTAFYMDEASVEAKIGSVGKVQSMTNMRLANVLDGQEGTGEIQFCGPAITPGYFQDNEATDAAFTPDGWLKSGDVGRRDADGYVYVVDRIKDMYISGGENVYPAEVEKVLVTHPDILEAAVIGVTDEKWGEVGAAFLLPRPDRNIDTAALTEWCRARLAPYKISKSFHVVDDFPRTAAGKIRKPDLKEIYLNAQV